MSNFDALKNIVRAVAPGIATALGGPAAGLAVASLSNLLLGKPNGSEDELTAAISSASPDTLIKLKEFDIELQRMHFEDVQSAREKEVKMAEALKKKDWVPGFLVIFVCMGFMAVVFSHPYFPDTIDSSLQELFKTLFTIIFTFYFGGVIKDSFGNRK